MRAVFSEPGWFWLILSVHHLWSQGGIGSSSLGCKNTALEIALPSAVSASDPGCQRIPCRRQNVLQDGQRRPWLASDIRSFQWWQAGSDYVFDVSPLSIASWIEGKAAAGGGPCPNEASAILTWPSAALSGLPAHTAHDHPIRTDDLRLLFISSPGSMRDNCCKPDQLRLGMPDPTSKTAPTPIGEWVEAVVENDSVIPLRRLLLPRHYGSPI